MPTLRQRMARPFRSSPLLRLESLEAREVPTVLGNLRIVDWNIANLTDLSATSTVIQAIGNETRAGLTRPVDVLLIQETSGPTGQTQELLNALNAVYGAGTYARGNVGAPVSGDTQGIIYRVASVDLISETMIGSSAPRNPIVHQLRPDGLGPEYDFYIINSHYKAGDTAADKTDRNTEATAIRNFTNALGQGTEVLYVGDYNIQGSSEASYQTLLAAGNGQAFDPINTPGSWNNSSSFRSIHTQNPSPGFVGGGMDDRFDFVLHTQEVGGVGITSNGIRLEYRSGSYGAFANNGTHPLNGTISQGTGASSTVLAALETASDHLPVVVDYDIVSIDPLPTVTFTTSSQSGAENVGTMTITAQLSATTTQTVTVPFSVSGTATGGGTDYTITASPITITPGQLTGTITITVVNDTSPESNETVIVTMGTPTNATQGATTVHTATITDNDQLTFRVTAFAPTATGFVADFDRVMNPVDLNLYDASGALGAADVTVTGPSGAVAGSLVVHPAQNRVTFVRTGGVLPDGLYTVTLRSAANGFKDTSGNLLDGDANGTAGDNYVTTFTVGSSARTVSLPDFARGYGQPVNVPATASGIPVRISERNGVQSVDVQFRYDPALISFGSATLTAEATAAGFNTVSFIPLFGTEGSLRIARLTVTAPAPATGSGLLALVNLSASVPVTAPYGSKEVLDLFALSVNGGAITARDDDAVHVAAYFGDATGNRNFSGQDAALVSRVAALIDSGFTAYQLADPVVIADITGNGAISGQDASLISVKATGVDVPQIPNPIAGVTPPPAGGPDPVLFFGTAFDQNGQPADLGALAPGQSLILPLSVFVTEPSGVSVAAVDVAFQFDPAVFTFEGVSAGAIASGELGGSAFSLVAREVSPGVVRISGWAARGPELAFGQTETLVLVRLTVKPMASSGSAGVNLLAGDADFQTALYDNLGRTLVLIPAPTDGARDDVDGFFQVVRQREPRSTARTASVWRFFAPPADADDTSFTRTGRIAGRRLG